MKNKLFKWLFPGNEKPTVPERKEDFSDDNEYEWFRQDTGMGYLGTPYQWVRRKKVKEQKDS